MNILFVTSEVAPFAKTGGLADVCAALPRQLHRHGHDVRLFVPLYARVAHGGSPLTTVPGLRDLPVRLGPHTVTFSVVTTPLPGSGLPVHFIHCPALYDRAAIYTRDGDEHLRFLLLCRAALTACQHMGFAPDVAHCHDWQAALIPLVLKCDYAWDRLFARTRTLLTIHNLNYQGMFRAEILPDTGLASSAHLFHQDQLKAGLVNFLMTGILYADGLTTVSPTYSREIQTEEHGAGLHAYLRARRERLVGILNGVDYDEWDPAVDRLIPQRYGPGQLELKERDKEALLRQVGLPYARRVPVLGMVSRLASQKGFDLVLDALPSLLRTRDLRFVLLGSGEPRLQNAFTHLQAAFPGRVCFYRGFSNELAHLIEAGADMFLMPSRYEPCGLNQMYSLKYGTVPVVRRTGGLADTVEPWDARRGRGTGFVFDHYTGDGLRWALGQALDAYDDPASWRRLQENAMAQDFSWSTQARRYEELYETLQTLPR